MKLIPLLCVVESLTQLCIAVCDIYLHTVVVVTLVVTSGVTHVVAHARIHVVTSGASATCGDPKEHV